jgi:hypothetical protein
MLRRKVSRPVCLGVKPPPPPIWRPRPDFYYCQTVFRIIDVWRSLWREDGSFVYNFCWFSPAQWFSRPSPAGLVIFYCLRFETPPTRRARFPYLYSPGTWWPSYTPRHWVPFRRLLRLAGIWWRYSNTSKTNFFKIIYIQIQSVPHRKHITSPLQAQPICAFCEVLTEFLSVSSIYLSLRLQKVECYWIPVILALICVRHIVFQVLLFWLSRVVMCLKSFNKHTETALGLPLILSTSH